MFVWGTNHKCSVIAVAADLSAEALAKAEAILFYRRHSKGVHKAEEWVIQDLG